MNAYLFSSIQSSIQSVAYGNLFECSTHDENGSDVVFSSMSHENEVGVMDDGEELLFASLLNTEGLKAKFSKLATEDGLVVRHPKNDLTNHLALLGELFHAAATLPPDPNAVLPERVRIATVRARLGQHRYKVSQAEMWGNACAVTGITETALLRARARISSATPWFLRRSLKTARGVAPRTFLLRWGCKSQASAVCFLVSSKQGGINVRKGTTKSPTRGAEVPPPDVRKAYHNPDAA